MIEDYSQEVEDNLVEAAMDGDPNAFGELARRYYDGMVTMIYHLCGDSGLAEDMVQETFLRAWKNLSSFRPTAAPLRNWLYRIAVNATLDTLRRSRKVIEYKEELQANDQASNPETTLLAKEQARQVQQAIASLPEAARIVLVLREYGRLSYREIAATLDIPLGTVMSRLNYARDHLRRSLIHMIREP